MQVLSSKLEWLIAGPARLPSGAYLSWHDGEGSGFPYPEASAVAVRAALWWNRGLAPRLIPTVRYLEQSVGPDGLVCRGTTGYLFDSALVLAAMEDAADAGLVGPLVSMRSRVRAAVHRLAQSGQGCVRATSDRWSTRFGPHLLKALALSVQRPAPDASAPVVPLPVSAAAMRLSGLQRDDGAFPPAVGAPAYLHAHCYAVEGLLMLAELGMAALRVPAERGVDFLAALQRSDGTLPQWEGAVTVTAADATAQAGRLFLLDGRAGMRSRAEAALAGLAPLSTPAGSLRYTTACDDENVWCTAFAFQLEAALGGTPLTPLSLV
jgi:hypothetical protein